MNFEIIKKIKNASKVNNLPLFLIAYLIFIASKKTKNERQENLLVILPEDKYLKFNNFLKIFSLPFFCFEPFLFFNETAKTQKTEIVRFLFELLNNRNGIFVMSGANFNSDLPRSSEFLKEALSLQVNEKVDPVFLTSKLVKLGYTREKKTFAPFEFSLRGEMIDLYSPVYDLPLRLETAFDRVKKINFYDRKTGRSLMEQNKVFCPALNFAKTEGQMSDYLKIFSSLNEFSGYLIEEETLKNEIDPLNEGKFSDLRAIFQNQKKIIFEDFSEKDEAEELSPFHLNPDLFLTKIKEKTEVQKIILSHEPKKIKQLLAHEDLYCTEAKLAELPPVLEKNDADLYLFSCPQNILLNFSNFYLPEAKLLLLSDHDFFKKKIKNRRGTFDEAFILSLKKGDLVVHIDHGVGRFQGMTIRTVENNDREFFILEYAKKDKIYLPVEYADKIAGYAGAASPKINRLHEISFKEVKEKIKKDTAKIAKELLETQARRELLVRKGYPEQKSENEFVKLFPFSETLCQQKTWAEIKKDLAAEKPMDRLVCGDVGFGKTEMALRAAFRVASNGKQAAILAPTTILAKQHYEVFRERFKNFPIALSCLSRLENLKKQKTAIEKIKIGKIDVIIGTHRLLSKDMVFGNLGLIIIDEEQRFGVKAKEKLKKLRSRVDILTLTATPIPRTLHLSLSGLKDISTLTTPPEGRTAVETVIRRYDDEVVKKGIEQELKRSGQVYYLHNRVRTIEAARKKIQSFFPKEKVSVVHGQLAPKNIAAAMKEFSEKKSSILICSSIIENGLDLPNVNTLIVTEATKFGLGDLYQLRGRIGRGEKKAHAYFLYHTQSLNENAKKRLKALLAARSLGSGFELALKDLEIRGVGNILGEEQSGRVKTLGLSHYLKLLNHAVKELKSGKIEKEIDVSLDVPLNAFIPKDLVESEEERLKLYQSLANIEEIRELQAREKELTADLDVSEFSNLFYVLRLKLLAKKALIKSIDTKAFFNSDGSKYKKIVLTFDGKTNYKKAYTAISKFACLEVEENRISVNLELLGQNWAEKLENIIKVFGV